MTSQTPSYVRDLYPARNTLLHSTERSTPLSLSLSFTQLEPADFFDVPVGLVFFLLDLDLGSER